MTPTPASLTRRSLAAVLDSAILLLLILPASVVFGVGCALAGAAPDSPLVSMGGTIIGLTLAGLYSVWTMSGPGQSTWGQRALGLRNYHLRDGRLDASVALGRYVLSMLSSTMFMMGYLTAFWSKRRQTLHDMLLGTMVVSETSHAVAMSRRRRHASPRFADTVPASGAGERPATPARS